jgi:hypothetical protein
MPDLGGACAGGCGGGSLLDNTTQVSSHEMGEAITDAAVGVNNLAWYDDANGEIGDICNGQPGTAAGHAIQLLWSNSQNACVAGPAGAGSAATSAPSANGATPSSDGACGGEQEPNDAIEYADGLGGCITGSLAFRGDIDSSAFTVAPGASYHVSLEAGGDATLRLYKQTTHGWRRVAGSGNDLSLVTSTGGTYVARVSSPTHATQGYTIRFSE